MDEPLLNATRPVEPWNPIPGMQPDEVAVIMAVQALPPTMQNETIRWLLNHNLEGVKERNGLRLQWGIGAGVAGLLLGGLAVYLAKRRK